MESKIVAVVVTYNKIEFLKKCIDRLISQSRKLDEIIVVDNSSTDGTSDWLVNQKGLTIITQENKGSAGGQYIGIKTAFEKGYEWIWSLDADVIPELDALEMFFNSEAIKDKSVGFLSSIIYSSEDKLSYINLPYLEESYTIVESLTKYNCLSILSSSFGSVLFSRNAIKSVGYPIIDFFIWGDDVEYTFRMRENGFDGYLIFTSKAIHYDEINQKNPFIEMDFSAVKSFYAVRNTIFTIKLRNKIKYNSKLRGTFSSFFFYFSIILNRYKSGNLDFKSLLKFSQYFLSGLIYNPRKFLKSESN
jgi:rhamnopyranosyl-N-acetylglucosaminyl-diphospho-decaprenol beta-1,3/1,4-galactofuranosyltransferase